MKRNPQDTGRSRNPQDVGSDSNHQSFESEEIDPEFADQEADEVTALRTQQIEQQKHLTRLLRSIEELHGDMADEQRALDNAREAQRVVR